MNFHLLEQYLDSLYEEYGLPSLDIVVTKDHETVYRHMAGFSDNERKRPVSPRDFYFMYSNTKLITMTAMMQLIEAGKASLYDPVCRFLPEWEYMTVMNADWKTKGPGFTPTLSEPSHYAKTQVRIIDCISMTAGLTYDIHSEAIQALVREKPDASTREVIAAVAKMPLLFEPGTRYQYSLGHDVIAAVIEAISGERYSDYLTRHIFEPLGITDLTCHMTAEQKSRLSAIYRYNPDTKEMRYIPDNKPFFITSNYESGGAALAGTTEAYASVVEALANRGVGRNGNRILKEESVMRFTHSVLTGESVRDFRVARYMEYSYGLGVRVKTTQYTGQSPIGEFGWDGAAGTYAVVDPFNHIGIFYVEHVLGFPDGPGVIHPRVRDLVYKGLSR
ncbi:MAG: beta-lactamase family protein [Clostridia bacterium]|nr:beta-lactamase family protein [Clostridia bacterium]